MKGFEDMTDGTTMNNKKKMKQAVALRYQREKDKAPVIIASGNGRIAERIVRIAQEHGVPVENNPMMTEALRKLKIGQEIPPELYEAVAVLLTHILELDSR